MAAVGASLVTDVLQKTGHLEKEDLKTSVGKLSRKADDVKTEVYTLIMKQYAEFVQTYDLTKEINSKVEDLHSEMSSINERIQGNVETQLQKANNLYTDLSEQLNEVNIIINVLKKLSKVHDSMMDLSNFKLHKQYLKVSEALQVVKTHLDGLPKTKDESKIFKAVRAEYLNEQSHFLHILDSLWDKCIKWETTTTPSWDNIDGHLKTKLTISNSDTTEVKLALQTLQSLKLLDEKLNRFGKRLLQFIIKPIIIFPRLQPVQNRSVETCVISFSKDSSKSSKTGITTMLQRIGQTLDQLSKTFMSITISPSNDEQNEQSLASMLGEIVWPSFTDIIIKDYLEKCVPTTSSQLEKYEETISSIAKFEAQLIIAGYLKEGTDTLQAYCKNITTHFSNKKCQDLLFNAREMLKTNVSFHNSKLISLPDKQKPVSPLADLSGGKTKEEADSKEEERSPGTPTETKLSRNMFHFPTCRVSECVPEFFNLVYRTLVEATETNKPGDVRLFYTARNMIELYRVVVPTYYEEDLRELPQMSALHYNNCMYLAHHLLTLGHQFRPKLPEPLNRGAATFVDMVSPIRCLGEKCFEDQLRKQSHIMLDILDSGGGFTELSTTQMEKSIRQVCFQLLKLSRVWKDILPVNIYKSALGTLLNISLRKFLNDVLQLEDISSDDSHSLYDLMGIFVEKSPEAIQISPEEMPQIVNVWKKFIELRCIIDSSLQNIEDRWKEGKGPLAQEFDSNEIRQLIRALFQNTDRRASVLSKIRPS